MSQVPGVYKKVCQLKKRLGAVEKNHEVSAGMRYKYRSYSDLFAAIQPVMIDLGLVMETEFIPTNLGLAEMQNKNGVSTGSVASGVLRGHFVDVDDGSKMRIEAPVVGMDSSDKAGGKAMSYAMKTAIFTALFVPLEDEKDHDATRPEAAPGKLAKFVERVREVGRTGNMSEYNDLIQEARGALNLTEQNALREYLVEAKKQIVANGG